MPDPRPEVLDFLLTRRFRPAKTLTGPAPDRAALQPLLQAAARCPDHGMLVPWRFIVLEGAALHRLSQLGAARARALGLADDRVKKTANMFANAPQIVAVVLSPKDSEKVPEVEQVLSVGGVCLGLLNAALAAGWGANWLTGIMAFDRDFLRDGLALADHETVAGYMVIGTEQVTPAERARPDLEAITDRVES
ncbi:nitroreductase family protein [Halovulum sp. GXIMD14793]